MAPLKEKNDDEIIKQEALGRKVEIEEGLLKELLQNNKDMQKQLDVLSANAAATSQGMPLIKRKKETFVKMRKWQDKYVLAWENVGKAEKPRYVYSEFNPQTRESIDYINLMLEGEKESLKLNYIEFLRESETIFVKVKARKELEDTVITQGMVQKKDFAENGYGMFETQVQVPVEVIIKNFAFEVVLEDGREIVMEEKFLG